jgi:hypothetical protein
MSSERKQKIGFITAQLISLRAAVESLSDLELPRVRELAGHQTTDASQSLELCFMKMDDSITDMEETLAAIAEATGEIEKL